MIVKSLDNVDVDITHCDAGYPPGASERSLILNTTAVWCKPADGQWIRSKHRSSIKTAHVVRHTNAKDLIAILSDKKEIGHEGSEASSSGDSAEVPAELQSLQGHSSGDATSE